MRIFSAIIAVIFFVTCFLGKSYYDSKVQADVQEANVQEKIEEKEKEKALKNKINNAKKEVSNRIPADIKKELNLVPIKTKAIEKLNSGQKATIIFLGDSTTEQNNHTNGKPGHVALINDFLKNTYGSEVTVVNAGVSGNTIVDMSNRIDKVTNTKPDLVVISSGINDVGKKVSSDVFEEKYKWIIEQIQKNTKAQIILRTPNKVTDEWVNRKLENDINPITQKLATEYKTGFVDLYSYYNYQLTKNNVEFSSVNNDNIHPNEKGQQMIADLLLYTLMGDN